MMDRDRINDRRRDIRPISRPADEIYKSGPQDLRSRKGQELTGYREEWNPDQEGLKRPWDANTVE